MKPLLIFLLLATSVLRAESATAALYWDSSKTLKLPGGCTAFAGPVWKTNGDHLDTTKTPPDFYEISVERKTANGSQPLADKQFPINEVDWPRLKKSAVADIIKFHAPTLRVGFFLKGEYATFVFAMPADTGAPAPAADGVSPPGSSSPASTAPAPDAPSGTGPAPGDLAKAKRFVPSVVYHVEKGVKENTTKRWVTLPRLEIVSKDTELIAFTTALNTAIFAAAGPLPQGDEKVTVYIGPSKELIPVRKKIAPQSGNGNWDYWSHWNGKRAFTGASIFILTDRMSPQEARQALAKSLMGVTGFPDESREYKESILYPGSQAVELAPIDKRLISFIYKHTEPGMGREALIAALNKHWQ